MDLSKKISIERVMNMTLDEYIYESGLFLKPIPPPYKSPHDTEDRFENITDEVIIKQEDEDCEMQDLRDKLSSNNSEQPNIRSQQWRLLPPNKSQIRPSGMPPLVPKDNESIHTNFAKQVKNNNNKWGNRWQRNNRVRRQKQHQRNNGQLEDNLQFRAGNKNNQYPLKRYDGINNTAGLGKRNGYQQWKNHKNRQNSQTLGSPMNMTIESTVVNGSLASSSFQFNEPVTNQPVQNDTLSLSRSMGILQPSSILDASGGIKLELMPLIAGKLLEALRGANNVSTPKYDLKVQKEIHTIQNKTMIYKCPGGDVVSSDGPGLPCNLTPASTGISLNQRFA